MKTTRTIKPGEALAIDPKAVQSGRDAFFWLFSLPGPDNERIGNIAVTHIRGPIEHHSDIWGDSYEAITDRVASALGGDGVEGVRPPAAVILRIDSPGGVVSGLTETVLELRRMSAAAGIPLIAYVDEMATSAAYALACACDEIYLPSSGLVGSIGVLSTMFDQSASDKKIGLRVVTLTSGARKTDGHPRVAISDDAIAAEQKRVDKLAAQFFELVAGVRGITAAKVKGLEAGLFLGAEAVSAGLADGVMRWDEVLNTVRR